MKILKLSFVLLMLFTFSSKAQLPNIDLIGKTASEITNKIKTIYKQIEFEKEISKDGEIFYSFYKKVDNSSGIMMDFYFKNGTCYKADYSTSAADSLIIKKTIEKTNIPITSNAWITKDRQKKIITRDGYLVFVVSASKLY